MKILLSTVCCVLIFASSGIAQINEDMFSLKVPTQKFGDDPEGPGADALCENLDDLTVGPLGDNQVSTNGVSYLANPAGIDFGPDTVVDLGGGDLVIQHDNVLGDDTFGDAYELNFTTANGGTFAPLADNGLVIEFDYEISDLNTPRFYTPIDATAGFIFTRLGDSAGDGNWEVLETDGAGGGVFFQTMVPIELSGHVEFNILDQAMEIFVNDVLIYTGGIIGSNGDLPGGVTLEVLTNMDFETVNNNTGIGSSQTVNNIEINGGCGCEFGIGDINQDGVVSLLDVSPFVALLSGGGFQCEADINEDGAVSLLDVSPFVALLSGG